MSHCTHRTPAPSFRASEQSSTTTQAPPVPSEQSSTITQAPPVPSEQSSTITQVPPVPSEQSSTITQAPPVPSKQSSTITQAPPVPNKQSRTITQAPVTVAGSLSFSIILDVGSQSYILAWKMSGVTLQTNLSPKPTITLEGSVKGN